MRKLSLLRAGTICVLSLILLLVVLFRSSGDLFAVAENPTTILIEKVHPYALNSTDEAVQLVNVSDQPVDLAGWGLSDKRGKLLDMTFPSGSILAAGDRIWVAHNGEVFEAQFGFKPDFAREGNLPGVAIMLGGSWPGYTNTGDRVVLANASGQIIDVLVYEAGDSTDLIANGEWVGNPVEFYGLGAQRGQIFFRKLDVLTGRPIIDSNSAADWGQDPVDPILGRRVQYPGWNIESFLTPFSIQETATLTVAIAPDNAFETIAALIDGAQSSIFIETHTFESHDLLAHLKQAAERGVEVKLLLEGGPPGGIDDAQRWNCHQLRIAGGTCAIMENDDGEAKIFDRYNLIHAKFMIIDGETAVVGSDNLSPNSLPADRKDDGTFGRRGVTLITDASGVVDHLQMVFADDFDQTNHRDILDWNPVESSLGLPLTAYVPAPYENGITHTVKFTQPQSFTGNFEFELVQVPENYLNSQTGLFGLLAQAKSGDTVLVQQQYERLYWGDDPEKNPNVRLQAYVEAARRGATVEVLLDSFFDKPSDGKSNYQTCKWLNGIALDERLNLLCQTGNPTGLGIHNKMVLVELDGRGYVHVGSINGSEHAAKLNRELALQVQSDGAYELLRAMFKQDFVRTTFLPIVFNEYETPTDQLLISEVLYNPAGTDEAEFIEIVNPSGLPIDISGYSLSDAVTIEDYADLRRFPAGTIIPAGSVLVVTQQAAAFVDQFGVSPNLEILETDLTIPNMVDDPSWGDETTFLRLGNSGDAIFLRDRSDNPLDVLVYGNKIVPGHPTCPAVVLNGASLRRNPFNYDTNRCSDFEEWGSPTPGKVP